MRGKVKGREKQKRIIKGREGEREGGIRGENRKGRKARIEE